MPNSKDTFKWIVASILLDEPSDEIKSIAYHLMDHFNISKSQIVADSELRTFNRQEAQLLIDRINTGEPIQYITGRQDFYGRSFYVDGAVLIPRPETEQLVTIAKDYAKMKNDQRLQLLDIGTGSGCMPITLMLEAKNVQATALDISLEAISVAERNNKIHKSNVEFFISDFLSDALPNKKYDIIVSNPPYITESEKSAIKSNVLNFEPHTALFVPDEDPLKFYGVIAKKSVDHLQSGGLIAVEINERYGKEVKSLFEKYGYRDIEIIKDLSEKDRIVKAIN